MVDFTLTETQRELQRLGHAFARNEIRPLAAQFDRVTDPHDSFPWEIYRKGNELGFNTALVPEANGGAGLGDLDFAILMEELAWGDVGVALTYLAHWLALRPLINGGNDDQRRRFLGPLPEDASRDWLAAICSTEHGAAGDLSPREHFSRDAESRFHVSRGDFATNATVPPAERREVTTTAIADGDEFVINGTKRFITNGPVASVYLVTGSTDPSCPRSPSPMRSDRCSKGRTR